MPDTAELDLPLVGALLEAPAIARHLAGLSRLRVAVTEEAGAVSGHLRVHGLEVIVTGPVDAEAAATAFHITRAIPREDDRLRLDFSYPPGDLSGSAEVSAAGRIEDLDTREG